MDNKTLLQQLNHKIQSGELTREEVLAQLGKTSSEVGAKRSTSFSLTKTLYVLGAAITIAGIAIFIGQIWDDIGSFGRILVTLGFGIIISAIGSLLFEQQKHTSLGPIFHILGGALIPGGIIVTFAELFPQLTSPWPITFVFGAAFILYVVLTFVQKHAVLTFFAIAHGTAFVWLFTESLLQNLHNTSLVYTWLAIITGGSYLLLGKDFAKDWNERLTGLLYFFGTNAVLFAAFSEIFDSVVWRFAYIAFVAALFITAVHLKSKIILALSTIYLIAYVSYITGEYFADSLGWPIALVLLGFIIIGLGYASLTINKTFLKRS